MIQNKPSKTDARTELLRGAIEHRATWFALMIEEAKKAGLSDEFAGKAVFRCGNLHGNTKYPKTDDLKTFAKAFANEDVVNCFEMDVDCTDKNFDIDFHYCPLVAAWKKLGLPESEMPRLCELAMEGDRGIIDTYDAFDFALGKTIANGDSICEVRITKK